MAIIGHQSPQMWKRYNTIESSDLRAAAAKMNTLITLNTQPTETAVANPAKT